MPRLIEGEISGKGITFAIVISRFNEFISQRLLDGALDALKRHGASDEQINIFKVPGAFEIPFMAKRLSLDSRFDCVICLGAVIRGATPHFEYISTQVSRGIASVALESRIPVSFGVITCDTLEQAIERAGAKSGNKGWDAAVSAMEMVNLFKVLD
ncbi:MAG: 6,7-dimethyl-8-ribityllumazine synthase [Desulfatiglandales bacterium]|jgi:6,7-dimethyl-8-ribityllumazine synthase|nr:MAG: 6,7-dimethyl-8-ribityllumazine synthase [Deltaproteobacteria bacterium]